MAGNEAGSPSGPNDRMERRIRQVMERSFRHDVSGVQAHTGAPASDAARSMGAQAYTTGNKVAFAKPADPHTAAHEAAHVVQQRAGVLLDQRQSSATTHAHELAHELSGGSTPPHEGRVVVMAPHVGATVAQSLGAAHATVKGLAHLERQGTGPRTGGSQ